MAQDHKYNGWTNYETWAVKLWMDNEEPSYRYWRERAEQEYEAADEEFTKRGNATFALADSIKEQHEEALPELEGFASDLLRGAFSEVNWHEIAESLIDDHVAELVTA